MMIHLEIHLYSAQPDIHNIETITYYAINRCACKIQIVMVHNI